MLRDEDVCALMGHCILFNNMNFIGSAFTTAGLQHTIQILTKSQMHLCFDVFSPKLSRAGRYATQPIELKSYHVQFA